MKMEIRHDHSQLPEPEENLPGKVRDLYEIDAKRMLMVATDRLSAFDVTLAEPIPEKGKILTAISNFWFDKLADLVLNHFTGDKVEDVVPAAELPLVEGRAVHSRLALKLSGGQISRLALTFIMTLRRSSPG